MRLSNFTFSSVLLQCSVPEGDLHCQCILSIFPASVHQFYANILVFVNINPFFYINDQFALSNGKKIPQHDICFGHLCSLHCQCILSIFPAGAHQLKCKHTCIEKCRPVFFINNKFALYNTNWSCNKEKGWYFSIFDTFLIISSCITFVAASRSVNKPALTFTKITHGALWLG